MSLLSLPAYHALVARFANDPLSFVHAVCGNATSPDQEKLLNAMTYPTANVSVVSGTGTGKTMCFGRLALWHLICFPVARYDGKIEVGSNTYIGAPIIKQVHDGVWKEITDAHQAMKTNPYVSWLAKYIIVQAERIYIEDHKKTWFISSFAMKAGESVAIAGKHRFHQLIMLDEAAGVPDEHYDVINGTQTQGGNRTLLASQGVKQGGFFYDTHHSLSQANGGKWVNFCFNSENSPFVTDEWLENVALQAGGKNTTEYRVRVLGQFAENENENLLTRAAVTSRFNTQVIHDGDAWGWLMLVDVGAGEYRDDSVCILARVVGDEDFGEHARRVEYASIPICTNSKNLRDFRGLLSEEYAKLSNARVVIDAGGNGLELCKMLEEDGIEVQRVQWGNQCFKEENRKRFFNQRACAMVRWRDAIKQGRVSFGDFDKNIRERFLLQAARLPYRFTDTGTARYQMWGKEQMRAKGIKSPDIADAMSFAFLDNVFYNVSDVALVDKESDLMASALAELADF